MFAAIERNELLALLAAHDRLTARVHEAVGAFDAAQGWDDDAATSMQAWLKHHAGMSRADANRLVRTARKLRVLPLTMHEWKASSISVGQVEAITSIVGRRYELFDEATMLPILAPLTVDETVAAMRHWRLRADALVDEEPDEAPGRVYLSEGLDGRGVLDGDLSTETYMLVKTGLRLADSGDLDVPAPERREEALATVFGFFLDNQQTHRGGRHRPHLNLIVDDSMRGHHVDGPPVTREVLERYFCDSTIHLLTKAKDAPLDLGHTTTRVITAALWVALVARDHHCRFPGCDRPATWCDAHHVTWFSHHGPTQLDNLALLCRRHHKRLHQTGWEAKLLPDGTFEVTDPTGRVEQSRPPGALEPFR